MQDWIRRQWGLKSPDTQDVVSQAFLRLSDQLERGKSMNDLRLRVWAMAHGLAANLRRDMARRSEDAVGLLSDLERIEEENLAQGRSLDFDTQKFRDGFDAAVRSLPKRDRDAFILTDLRGLGQAEAASVLGVSQQTISRRRESALTFIREELLA